MLTSSYSTQTLWNSGHLLNTFLLFFLPSFSRFPTHRILCHRYESVPESGGMGELVLQVLIVMLDQPAWRRALELYGPAPPRVYATTPHRVRTVGGRGSRPPSKTPSPNPRSSGSARSALSPEEVTRSASVAETLHRDSAGRTSLNQRMSNFLPSNVPCTPPAHTYICDEDFIPSV